MKKHICPRCGYMCLPGARDPIGEVPPEGVRPLCRAVKFAFDGMESP